MNGLVCTNIKRTSCHNGWLVHAILRNLGWDWSILVMSWWVFPLNPLSGHNTLPLVKLKRMQGMQKPPQLSRVGWHLLGWTHFHMAVVKPKSIYSLENWINFSLTSQGGGGLRLLPSWHMQPSLRGSRSLLKRFLKSQLPTNGKTRLLPPPFWIGGSFGISTRHRRSRPSFGQSFRRQWRWMDGANKSQ